MPEADIQVENQRLVVAELREFENTLQIEEKQNEHLYWQAPHLEVSWNVAHSMEKQHLFVARYEEVTKHWV